jgi:hypothetical protein
MKDETRDRQSCTIFIPGYRRASICLGKDRVKIPILEERFDPPIKLLSASLLEDSSREDMQETLR